MNGIINFLQMIGMVLAILVLGWLAANQIQEYWHGAELLSTPCELCMELNPSFDECLNKERPPTYTKDEILWDVTLP